jgi:hypothetical protein
MYMPIVKSARRVREHAIGPDRSAVLLTDIVGATSGPQYAHLLVVYDKGVKDPIAIISSEIAAMDSAELKELGLEDFDIPEPEGSHFLCSFLPSGHANYGASDAWGDLAQFEQAALDRLRRLGLATNGGLPQ